MTWFGRGTSDWQTERRRLIVMITGFSIAFVLLVLLLWWVGTLEIPG